VAIQYLCGRRPQWNADAAIGNTLVSSSMIDLVAESIGRQRIDHREKLSEAPGNGASVGGVKIVAEHAWFAARPSGTEEANKICADSFLRAEQIRQMQMQMQMQAEARTWMRLSAAERSIARKPVLNVS
jgi:phosphoglucomutase